MQELNATDLSGQWIDAEGKTPRAIIHIGEIVLLASINPGTGKSPLDKTFAVGYWNGKVIKVPEWGWTGQVSRDGHTIQWESVHIHWKKERHTFSEEG